MPAADDFTHCVIAANARRYRDRWWINQLCVSPRPRHLELSKSGPPHADEVIHPKSAWREQQYT
jgi:hypothetical protein